MLNICKASAGSGKTHKLTGEYLKMLFSGEYFKYKSILAVTFTNKATTEMKERILKELNKLAHEGSNSAFMKDICALEKFEKLPALQREPKVRETARVILSTILNDYSRFNISTIDKFFQKVLRAFASETGHFYSYNVNIDDSAILDVAIDELMNTLDDDPKLLEWLIRMSLKSVEEGKNWNSAFSLESLGSELFKEPFKLAVLQVGAEFLSRENIKASEDAVNQIMQDAKTKARELGERAEAIMSGYDIQYEDFKGVSRAPQVFFKKLKNGIVQMPTSSFRKLADGDISAWVTAKSPKAGAIEAAYAAGLRDIVDQVCEDSWIVDYLTAVEISRNITTMGILSDLQAAIRKYCHKNNIVMLSETTKFLSEIIDGSDTPFVYEKVGVRTENYLLDEFQDTSRMQWDNFLPLVRESEDSGSESLIVGDVKQSIYRWRGSDWKLLNSDIVSDFPRAVQESLEYNWRSSAEVVDFNNGLFRYIAENMPDNELVGQIYAGTEQKLPEGRAAVSGHVRVEFFEKENYNEYMQIYSSEEYNCRILENVNTLILNGYRPCDIAFIVRTNNQGTQISDLLLANGYNVVTDDALLISASGEVRRLVEVLRSSDFAMSSLEISIYHQAESALRELYPEGVTDPAAVNAFLDCVNEYTASEGNSMRGFLQWWDNQGVEKHISVPQGADSINVITVHKSKGLEFPAVILPYFEGSLGMGGDGYLWCKSPSDKYGVLPYYPINIREALENTLFADEYCREVAYSQVDTVNVSYVALTRAERELIVLSRLRTSKRGSVIELLHSFVKDQVVDGVYESGQWTAYIPEEKEEMKGGDAMGSVPSVAIGDRLKLSLRGEEFLSADSARRRGIVLHDILSNVNIASDLDEAITSAVDSGVISKSEQTAVEKLLRERLSSVEDRHWFDGTFRLINETPILTPEGENYRPDRIMISATGEAIVVDYKFGQKHSSEYVWQVKNYMSLLSRMGYAKVSGFIWYQDDIQKVV